MSYGQHRAIEPAHTETTTAVIESPMSFKGAYKRTLNLYDENMSAYWLLVILTLTGWWLAVLIEYAVIVAWLFIPLAWVIPYRVMRQRQRKERAMRNDFYARQLPPVPAAGYGSHRRPGPRGYDDWGGYIA